MQPPAQLLEALPAIATAAAAVAAAAAALARSARWRLASALLGRRRCRRVSARAVSPAALERLGVPGRYAVQAVRCLLGGRPPVRVTFCRGVDVDHGCRCAGVGEPYRPGVTVCARRRMGVDLGWLEVETRL